MPILDDVKADDGGAQVKNFLEAAVIIHQMMQKVNKYFIYGLIRASFCLFSSYSHSNNKRSFNYSNINWKNRK